MKKQITQEEVTRQKMAQGTYLGASPKPDKKELPKIGDLFHKLWGQAQDSPEYDKRLWGEFQRILQDSGFDV
jgi:hypothetical protein